MDCVSFSAVHNFSCKCLPILWNSCVLSVLSSLIFMREHVVFVFSFSSFFSFYLFISFLLTNRPKTTHVSPPSSPVLSNVFQDLCSSREDTRHSRWSRKFFFLTPFFSSVNVCILLESVQFLSWRICFRSPLLFFPFLNANIHFENSTFLRRPLFTFTRETLSSRKLAIFIRGFTL